MIHSAELCLGTVQFGLPYGITNSFGKVPESEVCNILSLAAQSGIDLLDTAQAYGDSEAVLGQCWPFQVKKRLISKLTPGTSPECWEDSLTKSLQRLLTEKLDTFLLHSSSDLCSAHGPALLDWLESLRCRGLVDRIGVSIYDSSELDVLPLNKFQVVQLPLSIYDQRLIRDGTIRCLHQSGIAVHARSVFLQGLLLQSSENWPSHLTHAFRKHHAQWLKYLTLSHSSQLASALAFVRACRGVEAVLVGVLSCQELNEVLGAWRQAPTIPPDTSFDSWAWDDNGDLDPRSWPPR